MPVAGRNWILITALATFSVVSVFVTVFLLLLEHTDPMYAVIVAFVTSSVAAVGFFLTVLLLFRLFMNGTITDIRKAAELAESFLSVDGSGQTGPHGISIARLETAVRSLGKELASYRGNFSGEVQHRVQDMQTEAAYSEAQNEVLKTSIKDLEKYKLAVKEAPVHIIITDTRGVIIYANRAASEITGYTVQEMTGQKPTLWGGQMPPEYYREMWKTINDERKLFRGEVKNRRKDGRIYTADIRIQPILDDQNRPEFYVGIEQDVTEIREADRIKNEFISLASHQLRSPLTAVRWAIETIKGENITDKSQLDHHLDTAQSAVLQMGSIVNDLLDVSRFDSGKMQMKIRETDINALTEDIVDAVKRRYETKNLDISMEADCPQLCRVDPGLVRQVIDNLVSNAVKYTRDGGTVTVSARQSGGAVTVSVTDSGIGIADNDKSRIFGRFFRADNALNMTQEGTGLGLYLAKRTAHFLGGDVAFDSTLGKGSTFTFTFPIVTPTS